MDPNSTFLISAKSDDELRAIIENRQKYLPKTVDAALAELKFRGHEFSAEELRFINEDMQARRKNAEIAVNRLGIFNSEYKYTIVEDPAAPSFYSRRALYVFTVLCGALFGSILLAININKTDKKAGILWVILFGMAFTALQVVIGEHTRPGSSGSVALLGGLVAAYALNYFFWNRYIGNATFYRVKPIWIPTIIGILIVGLLIMMAVNAPRQ